MAAAVEVITIGRINVAVSNKGEVVIWEKSTGDAYYFSLDEWEKINVFVLEQYRKMNDKKG